MPGEREMEVNDFEIVWIYTVDSGRWIKKRDEIKEIAEKLFNKAQIVEGLLRYCTAKELEARAGSGRENRAFFYTKDENAKSILKLLYESDMDNIDPEYLEGLRLFRAKLTTFEIVLPGDRIEPIEVYLLFHYSGIFILEFWLKIKNMALTPDIINEIQLMPLSEDKITFKLPYKLVKDYSMVTPKIEALLKGNENENSKISIEMTFHELVWIYWAIIAFLVTTQKVKDSQTLHRSLRYNVFNFFPVLMFNFPEVNTPSELIEANKAELYSMLSQEIYLKPEHIRPELIDEKINDENNIADRTDYALFFVIESCMLLLSQQSQETLEYIAKKRNHKVEDQIYLDKLNIILIQEFLQMQRFLIQVYEHLLSKKSISEMETDELALMRGVLSKGVEEFHNIQLFVKTNTIKWFEKGRDDVYDFDKSLDVLDKKLELIDSAVGTIHGNLMEFLTVLLGIVVQIGPIIALTLATENPILAILITTGAFFLIYYSYKFLYKKWYRSRKA